MSKDNSSIIVREVSVDYCSNNIDLWKDLVSDSNSDYIFSDYQWLKAFWQTYDGIYDSKIYIAIDEKTKKWLGVLPVTKYRTNFIDLYTTILSSTASEYSDYFSPIVRNQYRNKVIPVLLKSFLQNRDNVHLLRLSNITEENDLNSIIVDALNKFGMHFNKSLSGCPILLFKNKEKTEIFNSFKKKHRTDITRQIKRLENIGNLSLKIFENNVQIKENWNNFLKMYSDRWENSGQIDPMSKSRNKYFFKNMLDNLDDSFVHFSGLYLDDKPISYHIGFIYNNWFYYYKPTFDIEYGNYSPGKIHVWFLIEKGCEEGWKGFDFLKGFEEYKKNWTNHINPTYTYIISKKHWIRYYWQIKWKKRLKNKYGFYYRNINLLSTNIKRLGFKR